MKKCSYCGTEYCDDTIICAIDKTPLDSPPILFSSQRPRTSFRSLLASATEKVTLKDLAFIFGAPALCTIMAVIDAIASVRASASDKLAMLGFLPINFIFWALPQISWFLVMRFFNASRSTIYGGLICAGVVLLALAILIFFISTSTGDALAWVFYYPFVAVAMLIGGLIGRSCRPRKKMGA